MINGTAITSAQAHSSAMKQGRPMQPDIARRTTEPRRRFAGPLGLMGICGDRATAGFQNIWNFDFSTFVSLKQGQTR